MEMHLPAAILEARHTPASEPHETGIDFTFSPQLTAHFDTETRAMWSHWSAEPRPCFNPSLLADIRSYYEFLSQSRGMMECSGEEHPIDYVVLASAIPGVFNLGGDLDLFKQLIGSQDRTTEVAPQ